MAAAPTRRSRLGSSRLRPTMTEPEHIQLAPVRESFPTVGLVSGLANAVGFLLALHTTEPKGLTVIFFGNLTLFGAALSLAARRHALRTVRAPCRLEVS